MSNVLFPQRRTIQYLAWMLSNKGLGGLGGRFYGVAKVQCKQPIIHLYHCTAWDTFLAWSERETTKLEYVTQCAP
jgi:hypothetical protein